MNLTIYYTTENGALNSAVNTLKSIYTVNIEKYIKIANAITKEHKIVRLVLNGFQ